MTPAARLSSARPARGSGRAPTVDAACAAAVDLARAAALETADRGQVGEHVGTQAEADRVLTHLFACLSPGYRGWRWAVTVARAARSKVVTVDEVVLLPGPDALLAPPWVPWSERLRPGDLGVGDLLPTRADDERLVQGYEQTDDEDADRLATWELGLGRARVLSRVGRAEATDRWYDSDHGPTARIAQAAPAQCSTCGFFWPLAGSLRLLFGVCANEYSPDDGALVSADHGCGAHSQAVVLPAGPPAAAPVLDEEGYDVVAVHSLERAPGSVDDAAPAEELGHS